MVARANFTGQGARFVFERAETEITRAAAIEQVFVHEFVEAAAPFALGDMGELMKKKFAVPPTIGPNDNSVADRHTARSVRDNLGMTGRFRQFPVVRQGDPIDDQNANASGLPDANASCICDLVRIEGNAVLEDVRFLAFRPFASQRGEAFKIFFINHTLEDSLG